MEIGKVISVKNADHYTWGENSDGWHLLKNDELSVIEELMGPGTSERLHFHKKSQQLFYILAGTAVFEIDGQVVNMDIGETVHVLPGIPHRIFNKRDVDLRFIVVSSPGSHGDRTDL